MSIVEKYEKLDKLIHQNKEEEINELFRDILTETFELVNKKIENNETLDVNNEEEKAAIRAMFEYMLELWDEGTIDEAKEVGYDMVYLVDDKKLKEMFSMFVIGMLGGFSLDKFFDKYVKTDKVYKDVFFAEFDDKIDDLVIQYKDKFKKEFSKDA
ncbi:hypothetical protein FE773_06625 [Caminibacter mediatlanticus TB-2]|uniref:Uncharacterized protein n=1 Tax=Caminibacter mediatlanticus TB-2 TaxID=391592 RepID=A0AAI9AIF7_9BACT|nr:hypothetical protein [Caminibacter mediatlanticus]EDM24222.1 hypothetical protein CMTB2_01863 [Caminibacter mediatlanticus TB-2]QCT94869.1 hypothetical protein FE773_06625 [Caminibacter mediatlanticus TB-2]